MELRVSADIVNNSPYFYLVLWCPGCSFQHYGWMGLLSPLLLALMKTIVSLVLVAAEMVLVKVVSAVVDRLW